MRGVRPIVDRRKSRSRHLDAIKHDLNPNFTGGRTAARERVVCLCRTQMTSGKALRPASNDSHRHAGPFTETSCCTGDALPSPRTAPAVTRNPDEAGVADAVWLPSAAGCQVGIDPAVSPEKLERAEDLIVERARAEQREDVVVMSPAPHVAVARGPQCRR